MSWEIYLICGDDQFMVESKARELIAQVQAEQGGELLLERIDGRANVADEADKAVRACLESLQAQDLFFAGNKLVWFHDVNFLTGGEFSKVANTNAAKEGVTCLVEYLQKWEAGTGQRFLISTPKVLRSSVFFKTCQRVGKVADLGNNLNVRVLTTRVNEFLDKIMTQAKVRMASGVRQAFVQRVGYDMRTVMQEAEKLLLYIGKAKEVKLDDVLQATSVGSEAESWDLVDAVGRRNALEVLATLQRFSGQRSIGILLAVMLERNIADWLVLRDAQLRQWLVGRGKQAYWQLNALSTQERAMLESTAGKLLQAQDWLLGKKLEQASNYTLQELQIARFYILELREKLVTTGLPEMYLLETTLLRIIGTARVRSTQSTKGLKAGAG